VAGWRETSPDWRNSQTARLLRSIRLIGSCTADHHVRVNRPENWFPIVAQQLQDSFGSPRSSSAPTCGE
jgi:hypothetical protein